MTAQPHPLPPAYILAPPLPTAPVTDAHIMAEHEQAKADHVEAFLDGWYGVKRSGARKWSSLDGLRQQAAAAAATSSASTSTSHLPFEPLPPPRPPRRRSLQADPSPTPVPFTSPQPPDPPADEPRVPDPSSSWRSATSQSYTSRTSCDTFGGRHVSRSASACSGVSDHTHRSRRPGSSATGRASRERAFTPIASPTPHDESDEEEDEVEERVRFQPLADVTLRSEPGVRGIGEGWAGGPQRGEGKKSRRVSWLPARSRSQRQEEADPLALWGIDENKGDPGAGEGVVKGMWNRSKLRLFGSSTPALTQDLPKRNLSQEDKRAKRMSLTNLLSRSKTNLGLGAPAYQRRAQSAVALSTPVTIPPTPPARDASLPVRRHSTLSHRYQAPGPTFAIHHGRGGPVPPIPEALLEEESGSQTSLVPSIKGLPRTSTFGIGEEPDSDGHGNDEVVGLDTLVQWVERGDSGGVLSGRETPKPGDSLLAKLKRLGTTSSTSRPLSVHLPSIRSPTPSSKRNSVIVRPFPLPPSTPGQSREISTTTTTTATAVTTPDPSTSAYDLTRQAVQEALITPHHSPPPPPPLARPSLAAPHRTSSTKKAMRQSWGYMLNTSESFLSRFSRFADESSSTSPANADPDVFSTPLPSKRTSKLFPSRASSMRRQSSKAPTSTITPLGRSMAPKDISLQLDALDGGDLGLADILDESRRRVVLTSMGIDEDLPLPPAAAETTARLPDAEKEKEKEGQEEEGSTSMHSRTTSDPLSLTPGDDELITTPHRSRFPHRDLAPPPPASGPPAFTLPIISNNDKLSPIPGGGMTGHRGSMASSRSPMSGFGSPLSDMGESVFDEEAEGWHVGEARVVDVREGRAAVMQLGAVSA